MSCIPWFLFSSAPIPTSLLYIFFSIILLLQAPYRLHEIKAPIETAESNAGVVVYIKLSCSVPQLRDIKTLHEQQQ